MRKHNWLLRHVGCLLEFTCANVIKLRENADLYLPEAFGQLQIARYGDVATAMCTSQLVVDVCGVHQAAPRDTQPSTGLQEMLLSLHVTVLFDITVSSIICHT